MRLLKKLLTREAPLIAVESWYDGMVKYAKEFFGIPFPENLFLFRNQTTECYRDIQRLEELPREIARWSKNNPGKINELYQKLDDAVKTFDNIQITAETMAKEILQHIHETKRQHTKGLPGLFCMHWLPILQEKEKIFEDSFIKKTIKWREKQGHVFFNKAINTFYSLLQELAKRKGWESASLKYVTFQELTENIENQKPLPIGEVKKRQNSTFAYINGEIIYEPEIDQRLKVLGYKLAKEDASNVPKLKGMVANKGVVRGKVKVVYSRNQLSKVKEGDILVAPMTSPWYMQAIHKSSAIVTDEGGITCHAAIVSRELKKPCIIGTKIATEILKDGDLIEVDADKGEVKILSKLKINLPK